MTDDQLDRLLKERFRKALPTPVELGDGFSESLMQQLPPAQKTRSAYPRWLMIAYWLLALLLSSVILYLTAGSSALSSAVITLSLVCVVGVVLLFGKLAGFRFSDVFQASLRARVE